MRAIKFINEKRYVELRNYLATLHGQDLTDELENIVYDCSVDTVKQLKWALQDHHEAISDIQYDKK